MKSELRAFTSGRPLAVDLAAVERELNVLWKTAGEAEGPASVMRACALNLVVYDGRAGRPLDEETLRRVTMRHPCRVLVARVDDRRPAGPLETWVTALCHTAPGGNQVCCEQVTVVASARNARDFPGAVLPLTVGELPVFVWWRAPLPRTDEEIQILEQFVASADRLLFDEDGLAALLALVRRYPEVAFGHLDWARLTPWRATLAQFFDAPSLREKLAQISRIRTQGDDTRARLLAGWLRTRLEGRPAVELDPGPLESVALEGAQARFELAASPRTQDSTRPGTLKNEVHLEEVSDHEALSQELRYLGHDRAFEEALESAANL